MKPGFFAVLIISLFLTLGTGFLTHPAGAAPGSFTFSSPGLALASSSGLGYLYLPSPCTYASRTMSGDLVHYTGFTMLGTTWDSIGLGCEATVSMNLTSLSTRQLVYTLNSTTGDQWIWCPDHGEPASVVGGSLSGWSGSTSIATITPSSTTVRLSWPSHELNTIQASLYGYYAVMALAPLIGAAVLMMSAYNGTFKPEMIGVVVGTVIGVVLGIMILGALFMR